MNDPSLIAPSAVCANCRRRLLPYENRDERGNVLSYGYQHPKMLPGVDCPSVDPIPLQGHDRDPDQVSVCDFCGCAGVSWDYQSEDFPTPNDPGLMMTGMWSACEDCHADIEEERWVAMARRQYKVFGSPPTAVGVRHFVSLFDAFAKHRKGPATRA